VATTGQHRARACCCEGSGFGQAARARRTGTQSAEAASAQRGRDSHARIELDLPDAYHGAERTLTLGGARLDAGGHLVNEERQLQVSIPKGVREGQLIRLAGQGGPGLGGAPAGGDHHRSAPQ